jgi:hypothetical protein
MKRFTYILVGLVAVCFISPAEAQVDVGIVGGLNFADLNLDIADMGDDLSMDLDGLTSYGIGAVVDVPVYKNIYIRLEPMYLKRGGGLQADIPFDLPNIGLSVEFSYIELPFLLRAEFGDAVRPYILAGPTFGFLLDSYVTVEALGIGLRCSVKEIMKTFHPGITYGAGIRYPVGDFCLFLEGRYTLGLSNIIADGPFSIQVGQETIKESISEDAVEMKTKGLQLMVGITMPLGKH